MVCKLVKIDKIGNNLAMLYRLFLPPWRAHVRTMAGTLRVEVEGDPWLRPWRHGAAAGFRRVDDYRF